MKKAIYLILLAVCIIPINCDAEDTGSINEKTVQKMIQHYFSAETMISQDSPPNYVKGDFNGDGLNDVAVLFHPQDNIKSSKRRQLIWPWAFNGSIQPKRLHKSLAIINGHPDGWMSQNTKVFALLDNSSALETPSIKLIVEKISGNEHFENIAARKTGDLLLIPTQAGIDTYVYWDHTTYKLHIPEEQP